MTRSTSEKTILQNLRAEFVPLSRVPVKIRPGLSQNFSCLLTLGRIPGLNVYQPLACEGVRETEDHSIPRLV